MLSTLHIKNIGIIEDLTIDFQEGFNALTGETGAGKSLIIDSIAIIAGGRFSKEMIRKNQKQSYVEACFYMPNHKLAIDDNIIVSREIFENGRNLCKINGRMVTVSELKNTMKNIIDIHGQNDNQLIMDSEKHLMYLDGYIGDAVLPLKNKYCELYSTYNKIKNELKANYGDDKEKQRKLDLLKYQFDEINDANLNENEEDILIEKRNIILNSEKIVNNLNIASESLDSNVIEGIDSAISALEKISSIDSKYEKNIETLKSCYYDIQEIALDICEEKQSMDFDEQTRQEIEDRLDIIRSLKRKYGNTISEILNYKEEVKEEINRIENLEEYTSKLKKELKTIEDNMIILCEEINELRNKYAIILSKSINKELIELEMKNAKFSVRIEKDRNKFNENGFDNIEFCISTNIGEDSKALTKIASGGELSRIMLAIKTVLSDVDETPTIIFDEIDTGISGAAAKAVGIKMKKISTNHQILVITHLPVIAATADYNLYITKEVSNENTKTKVKILEENEVIEEIARMSTGEISKISIENAKELRKKVKMIA